jgi:superfamily II DNA or RNA helicase
MSDVFVEKIDEVNVRIHTEPSIKMELSEYFEFYVPGYKFMPKYKNRQWDGKIRLFNSMSGLVYNGLTAYVKKFCDDRGYKIEIDPALIPDEEYMENAGYDLAQQFDAIYEPHYYQNEAVAHGLSRNRALFLSPTASGKSFTIYLLARHFVENLGLRVLIIVPTISLVSQMATDFLEYNKDRPLDIHKIKSGADKDVLADYTITTWQSIQRLPGDWYEKFGVVFGDEAHLFKAKSLTKILEKTPYIQYRYGLTGSLDDSQTHRLVLEGLFGPVKRVTKTRDLIDEGKLADFRIKAPILQWDDESRKLVSKMKYQEEIDWIVSSKNRNRFITKMAHNLPGNTLILFQFVEKHGEVLLPMLQTSNKHRIHYVHGGVDADAREEVRRVCEASTGNIVLASYGTFSTGINIKRLDNVIFASPSKSKIRNLQSIGRVLRTADGKTKATLFDIVDDLQWKKRQNFAVKHFFERVKVYNDEGFDYNVYNVPMKG